MSQISRYLCWLRKLIWEKGVHNTFNWDVIIYQSSTPLQSSFAFSAKTAAKRQRLAIREHKDSKEVNIIYRKVLSKCPSIGRLLLWFWPFYRWQFCPRRVFHEWQTKMAKRWYPLFHNRAATTRATARGWPASARTWTCRPRSTWGSDTLFTTLEMKSGEKKQFVTVEPTLSICSLIWTDSH